MRWIYLLVVGTILYFGYTGYKKAMRKKVSRGPNCESCGSVMVLQSKSSESEIWVCEKCNPDN